MEKTEIRQKKIWFKRYAKPRHFITAIGCDSPIYDTHGRSTDYEMVQVVRSENCKIAGKRCLISWGLHLSPDTKTNRILAFFENGSSNLAEVVLARSTS